MAAGLCALEPSTRKGVYASFPVRRCTLATRQWQWQWNAMEGCSAVLYLSGLPAWTPRPVATRAGLLAGSLSLSAAPLDEHPSIHPSNRPHTHTHPSPHPPWRQIHPEPTSRTRHPPQSSVRRRGELCRACSRPDARDPRHRCSQTDPPCLPCPPVAPISSLSTKPQATTTLVSAMSLFVCPRLAPVPISMACSGPGRARARPAIACPWLDGGPRSRGATDRRA